MKHIEGFKHIGIKGRGYFCQVVKHVNEQNGNELAVKSLKPEHYPKKEYRYRLEREIKLLQELQGCENIIQLLEYGHDSDLESLWYIMPFASGNLHDYIRKNITKLTPEQKYDIIRQVINAIKYAHNKNILHRDISPNNVLVFENNEEISLRVCDFGLGKDAESLSYYTGSSVSGYGQILYVSPEQSESLKNATEQSDIYSLGKLIYFIFTGREPKNIKPFELSSLVIKATEDEPEKRYKNIEELEAHFNAIRAIHISPTINNKYLTVKDVIEASLIVDWDLMHEVLVRGNYVEHVYKDYLKPTTKFLLGTGNLSLYYKAVGNSIRDFVKTYSENLDECFQLYGWPFSETENFSKLLVEIIMTVDDDETKLLCHKQLWNIAFVKNQYAAQREIKNVFHSKYIPKSIENQLAEYIIAQEGEIDVQLLFHLELPTVIKASIIKVNEIVEGLTGNVNTGKETGWI
jgi:serine/threonine protein kinase